MKGDCGHTLDTSALRNVQLLTNKVGSVLKSFDTYLRNLEDVENLLSQPLAQLHFGVMSNEKHH